jgi:energy-coupling factor transporter ATP-binding protein EcfA2
MQYDLANYFKLPIETLPDTDILLLPNSVNVDLELENTIHPLILAPQSQLGKNIVSRIQSTYTVNTDFLKETQTLVSNIQNTDCTSETDAQDLLDTWNDIHNEQFHERYGYMDIDKLKFVNRGSTMMHYWSIANLISPVFAILLPFLFILAPFIILRIKSVPITFATYLTMLKDIAKSHAIGKTLTSLQDFSMQNVIYVLFTLGIYGLQMYQNCQHCFRFYNNIFKLSSRLQTVRKHIRKTANNIRSLLDVTQNMPLHKTFSLTAAAKLKTLDALYTQLEPACSPEICETTFGFIPRIGNILQSYYLLMDNPDYKSAYAYSLMFEGYWSGLQGIKQGVECGLLAKATFTETDATCLTNQLYPVLGNGADAIKNNIKLDKNVIITGPNASGKTTQLKATAINLILSQQIGFGCFEVGTIKPYTHFHSYLNIPDTSGRDSLFQAEARRCKEIIEAVDTNTVEQRHFCIFDELFSGTNSEEATLASFGFLKYLQQKSNVDFILTTHFTGLCKRIHKEKDKLRIRNMRMEATLVEQTDIAFTYKLLAGINTIKAARIILVKMGFPQTILDGFTKT